MKPGHWLISIVVLGIGIGVYSSRPTAPPERLPGLESELLQISRKQRTGLDGATVKVHSA